MSCLTHLIQPSGLLWVPAMRWCSVPCSSCLSGLLLCVLCPEAAGPCPDENGHAQAANSLIRTELACFKLTNLPQTARHLCRQTRTYRLFPSSEDIKGYEHAHCNC